MMLTITWISTSERLAEVCEVSMITTLVSTWLVNDVLAER